MRGTFNIKTHLCLMSSLLLVLSGCATTRIAPDKNADIKDMRFELITGIEHDEYGRPVFGRKLDERPTEPGSLFVILARDRNGFPQRSYLVAVTAPGSPDMARPFNVLYRWTDKGFNRAGKLLKDIFTGEPRYQNSTSGGSMYLFVAATGVTIYIAGGVVVGIADGTLEAGREMGKLLVNGEEVLASYSTYEYDHMGRIKNVRSYVPGEPPAEMISMVFTYSGDSAIPAETLTRSIADDTEQKLVFGQ